MTCTRAESNQWSLQPASSGEAFTVSTVSTTDLGRLGTLPSLMAAVEYSVDRIGVERRGRGLVSGVEATTEAVLEAASSAMSSVAGQTTYWVLGIDTS
jgi:hypothetical protein